MRDDVINNFFLFTFSGIGTHVNIDNNNSSY